VRGVVRCLAPRRRSSSSLSPRLLCAFFKENVALIHWDGGGSRQYRRALANPGRFVGWCAGNDYLL
jgi:hypothetical protein